MFCTSAGIQKPVVGYLNSTTLFIGVVVNQIFSWGLLEKNEKVEINLKRTNLLHYDGGLGIVFRK
jgi:hypothetical protein